MSRYLTADVLAVPPTIDDIADALKSGKLYCSKTIREALEMFVRLDDTEHFNFGPLNLDTVREAQHEAIDFVTHGHFVLPYAVCMYSSRIKYDNCDVGTMLINVNKSGVLDMGTFRGNAVVRIIRANDAMFAMHCICTDKTQLQAEGMAIQIELRQHELDYWGPYLPTYEETQWQLTEGALCMLGMTMIVNTKGLYKERLPYPTKPNAKRLQQGRPLLPQTTRIYTNVYNHAVQKGEKGTHASPRPHRRRAHIRHYPATETREAYVQPIEAMLINWDGKPLEARKEYVVK